MMRDRGHENSREVVLNIPSADRYVHLVDVVVSYIADEMQFDEVAKEKLELAIIEAATNAIKHGNRNDPEKMVQFRFCITEDKLTVFVKDSGSGFDPEGIKDPLSMENLMKPCGRGIFLMRTLMDEVEYKTSEGSGTEVRMVKYRNSPEPILARYLVLNLRSYCSNEWKDAMEYKESARVCHPNN